MKKFLVCSVVLMSVVYGPAGVASEPADSGLDDSSTAFAAGDVQDCAWWLQSDLVSYGFAIAFPPWEYKVVYWNLTTSPPTVEVFDENALRYAGFAAGSASRPPINLVTCLL